MLRDINRIVSDLDANIQRQVLATDPDIGYLIMDLDQDVSNDVTQGDRGARDEHPDAHPVLTPRSDAVAVPATDRRSAPTDRAVAASAVASPATLPSHRDRRLQSKILPGFKMPCGSSACLIAAHHRELRRACASSRGTASSAGRCRARRRCCRACFFTSVEQVAVGLRACCARNAALSSASGFITLTCRLPSPMWPKRHDLPAGVARARRRASSSAQNASSAAMGSAMSFLCGSPVADRLSLMPSRSAQSSAACVGRLRERRRRATRPALEERRDPRRRARRRSAPSTSTST